MTHALELEVMTAIARELERLPDEDSRGRALNWAGSLYRVAPAGRSESTTSSSPRPPADIGELFERASPQGTQDRILTAAYWMHDGEGSVDFDSKSVNDSLKDMGHPVANITKELTRLMAKSPQMVRQTEKTGRSKQARKRYRLTEAGRKRVEELLGPMR